MVGLNVSFLYLSNSDQDALISEIRLPSETDIQVEQYLVMNEIFTKIGFASSLFSTVESALREYLRFIDIEAYKKARNIESIFSCLVDRKLEWDTYKSDYSGFNFLRLMRNTLHNNGVHIPLSPRETNITIHFKGNEYAFSEGERINFVTWDLLLEIANDMRTLLFQLAINKTIRSVPDLIRDPLAI
jgi:hypothetical protein